MNDNTTLNKNSNTDVLKIISEMSKNIIDSQQKQKQELKIPTTPSSKFLQNQDIITPSFGRTLSFISEKKLHNFNHLSDSSQISTSANIIGYKSNKCDINSSFSTKENIDDDDADDDDENKPNVNCATISESVFSKPLINPLSIILRNNRNEDAGKKDENSLGSSDYRLNKKDTKIIELTNFNSLLDNDIQNSQSKQNTISLSHNETNPIQKIFPMKNSIFGSIPNSHSRFKQNQLINNNTSAQDLQAVNNLITQNNSTDENEQNNVANHQRNQITASKSIFGNRIFNNSKGGNVPYLLHQPLYKIE